MTDDFRLVLLVLTAGGILLALDNIVNEVQKLRKGRQSDSDEPKLPPSEDSHE